MKNISLFTCYAWAPTGFFSDVGNKGVWRTEVPQRVQKGLMEVWGQSPKKLTTFSQN